MDRVTHFAVAAAKLAIEDAKLDMSKEILCVAAFALAAVSAASTPSWSNP